MDPSFIHPPPRSQDLCSEHKHMDHIYEALKGKDKFSQTPMLSAVNATENRNEVMKFLLQLILDRKDDHSLQVCTLYSIISSSCPTTRE